MTAARTLAIGALMLATAVPTAVAGPYSGTFNWTSWNAGNGTLRGTGTASSINLSPVSLPVTNQVTPVITPPIVSAPTVYPVIIPATVPAPIPAPDAIQTIDPTPRPIFAPSNNDSTSELIAALAKANALPPTAYHPIAVSPVLTPLPIVSSVTTQPAPAVLIPVQAQAIPVAAPVQITAPVQTASFVQTVVPVQPVAPAHHIVYDGYINLAGNGFLDSANLTAGAPQAWYKSGQISGLFGGQPTSQQQADFNNAVLQHVQQTFDLAGVHVNLTTDPNAQAAHTLSLVSNTQSAWGPLLGLTNIGGNGFSFIDQSAKTVQNVDQLEWLVAHNVAHELMLAFGVGENYDKSGKYIDSEIADLSMMLNSNATFSKDAAAALLATSNFNAGGPGGSAFAQELNPQPVPEPTTILVWTLAAAGLAFVRHKRTRPIAL